MSTPSSALFALLQQSQQYTSNADVTWLKFTPGTYKIRICPPWSSENTPVRMLVQHQGYKTKDGFIRMPLCWDYVFKTENIGNALIKRNPDGTINWTETAIKPEDIKFYQQYGCVYCKISEIHKNLQGKTAPRTYAKPIFVFNVLDRRDDKIYKWSCSRKQFEAISMFAGAYPTMFNENDGMDLMIMVSGEGLSRKYSLTPIANPIPLGVDLTKTPLHNLDQAMADGYRNLNETMELILNTYPNMLPILGINPATLMTGNIAPF